MTNMFVIVPSQSSYLVLEQHLTNKVTLYMLH